MKTKLFFLSTIISSCILSFACNQSTAHELNTLAQCGGRSRQGSYDQPYQGGAVTNPNMPTAVPNTMNGRPCYPASKCVGDPNMIGGRNGGGTSPPTGKVLQIESTEKFVGTVQSVNRVNMPNQIQVQMVLSTDQGDVLVILGPAKYLDQQKIKFQAGDKVTVLGFRVKANGKDVITAAQVQRNGNTLQLLDERRQPIWGGGMQGGQPYGSQGGQRFAPPQNGMQNGYQG